MNKLLMKCFDKSEHVPPSDSGDTGLLTVSMSTDADRLVHEDGVPWIRKF